MRKLFPILLLTACIITGENRVLEKIGNVLNNDDTETNQDVSNCLQQDVDTYLDRVLEQVREQIPEPMRLPPRISFAELSEGRIWGMKTLHRFGSVQVSCNNNETVVISGQLATEELKARYTWEKEIGRKKREGFVLVKTNDFIADVEMVINSGEEHPSLQKFKIHRFKDIRVEMTGLGLFTWALAEITTMMSGIFQWAIARAVQDPLREALERELMEISLTF